MIDPIRELKIRAKLLQQQLHHRHPHAISRLRSLPEFRARTNAQLESVGPELRRRHCLTLVSVELGFGGWVHARAVLSGACEVSDFGTLLYPVRCSGHLNLWYRRYDDAVVGRRESAGYLLAYRRDFLVVDSWFIETLGLDPDANEWLRIGFDWVHPTETEARTRLYGALVAQLPRQVA
jgi:hypothetical protein